MRSLTLFVLVLCFAVNLVMALSGAGEKYDRKLIREYGDPEAEPPKIKAEAAALYSVDLEDFVYVKEPDKKMAPYSMTKLLTCYLALENMDPDDVITVSKNATKELEDGMEMELSPGEQLKMIDMVYGAMLMSANDAATALGEAVGGSEKGFADMMNETAAGWGCENTHFVNANGWDPKKHYTTARDMAIITRHCLENETLRKIATTEEYTIPASNMSDPLKIENALLKATGDIGGVTGGKTGSWSSTQCTITFEFTEDALTGIVVLLGDTADGRQKDSAKLVKFSHKVTPGFMVTDSDKEVCRAWVKGGAETKVPLSVKGRRYAYPKNRKPSGVRVETEIGKLKAPVKRGDKCGKYYIRANGKIVGQGYLYAAEDVRSGLPLSKLYVSDSAGLIAVIILLLLAVLEVLGRTGRIDLNSVLKYRAVSGGGQSRTDKKRERLRSQHGSGKRSHDPEEPEDL